MSEKNICRNIKCIRKEITMEICYDGALVMPKNYAVVDEEEMEYVEGGFAIPTWLVGGTINLALGVICGNVSSFLAKAAKSQITAACKRKIMDEITEKNDNKRYFFCWRLCNIRAVR